MVEHEVECSGLSKARVLCHHMSVGRSEVRQGGPEMGWMDVRLDKGSLISGVLHKHLNVQVPDYVRWTADFKRVFLGCMVCAFVSYGKNRERYH